MTDTTLSARSSAALAGPARSLRADLRGRWARWTLYRRTLAELSALGPRELADMGLSRASLREAARQAVYGEGAPYARG